MCELFVGTIHHSVQHVHYQHMPLLYHLMKEFCPLPKPCVQSDRQVALHKSEIYRLWLAIEIA